MTNQFFRNKQTNKEAKKMAIKQPLLVEVTNTVSQCNSDWGYGSTGGVLQGC